ncbi:MAG: DPP IV N-terminal domain-containing protein [Bacteroidales bacterium]|nr:DPP IV N-terminal domain-containing protein [Bacteroidales bacterium]
MRKSLLIIAAALCAVPAIAQEGVKVVHPASNPNGKMLTMEEVILSRDIVPSRMSTGWQGDSQLLMSKGGKITALDVTSGQEKEYAQNSSTQTSSARASLPKGASDVTPKGDNIAYTVGKSLYYVDKNGHSVCIAESENNQITYGQSVSRNEFGIGEGIYWSDSGKKLAFYRKDESLVTTFPLLDITSRTGSLFEIKYPMAGMDSENIRLGIYDLAANTTVWAQVDDFGYDQYLTNISWSPDDKYVFIQVLDRAQENVHLNMYRASDGQFVRTILTEHNDRFVEPENHIEFLKGTYEFIYRTDNRDGYKNLYLCDTLGTVRRMTAVDADVTYVDNDGKNVYYMSAEVSPVENHLFRVPVSVSKAKPGKSSVVKFGKPVQLTKEEGWHSVSLNPSMTMFVDSYSSFNVPSATELRKVDGTLVKVLDKAEDPLKNYAGVEVDFGTVKSADGQYDNWYRLFKPANFDPSKKYPVILYVYGGPHSQMVRDTWLGSVRMWEYYMAQKGYIVYVQDNRGTPNRGAEYEKAIHGQCGQVEMQDQMVGINMLKSLPYVDSSRIGVHGWSYGGFMTISLITNYPETFKVGVAGGPVIDWKWYEVMYGERYMDTPQRNPEGFAKTSLINKAKDLKGKLLICQGAIDDTVVWEHSLSFIRECIKNNVQVDYFPYPTALHNVQGRDRIHLMDKVTMYFEDYL